MAGALAKWAAALDAFDGFKHNFRAPGQVEKALNSLALDERVLLFRGSHAEIVERLSAYDQVEGTGPAYPPVDSSSAIADQLFAPFPEDLFSAELDVHALKKMLTQPLTAQVPVISSVFTQYCLLMPALYRSSTTENARGLISRFDSALAQLRPTGSGSELNHTGFWDSLGFKLPEFAQQYMDCGVSCSRGVEDESIASPKGKRDYICLVDNMLVMVKTRPVKPKWLRLTMTSSKSMWAPTELCMEGSSMSF
ncbi:TPA: hypothetical protein ACH3X1_009558 [Trebouxia sp. C0004]